MKRQYCCVVKLVENKVGRFVQYDYVNNLMSFTKFLDKKWPTWTYFNVFTDETKAVEIASFTKNDRPNKSKLSPAEIESFQKRPKRDGYDHKKHG